LKTSKTNNVVSYRTTVKPDNYVLAFKMSLYLIILEMQTIMDDGNRRFQSIMAGLRW